MITAFKGVHKVCLVAQARFTPRDPLAFEFNHNPRRDEDPSLRTIHPEGNLIGSSLARSINTEIGSLSSMKGNRRGTAAFQWRTEARPDCGLPFPCFRRRLKAPTVKHVEERHADQTLSSGRKIDLSGKRQEDHCGIPTET